MNNYVRVDKLGMVDHLIAERKVHIKYACLYAAVLPVVALMLMYLYETGNPWYTMTLPLVIGSVFLVNAVRRIRACTKLIKTLSL